MSKFTRESSTPGAEPTVPAVKILSFVTGYDDPLANVIIVSSDQFGLRVHNYYLKAASPLFREMLDAGTKGSPVPLEATALQLEFMMDIVTGKFPRVKTLKGISREAPFHPKFYEWRALWNLIEMDKIAKKYLLTAVSRHLHRLIAYYAAQNPPETFLYACTSYPVDAEMAACALRSFEDEMPSWLSEYFEDGSSASGPDERVGLNPAAHNLRQAFAENLGLKAHIAYTKALRNGCIDGKRTATGGACYDWNVVTSLFLKAMQITVLPRYWLLEHEDNDVKSGWSSAAFSPTPSPELRARDLVTPMRTPPPEEPHVFPRFESSPAP